MQRRLVELLLAASGLLAASLGALSPHPARAPVETSFAAAPAAATVLPRTVARVERPAKECRAGLVALTFDDGPSRTVTPVLVHSLVQRQVPATFFMVGSRIRTAPAAARLVYRSGFVIGNHTWSHADLPTISDMAIRQQLRSTRREMRAHGIVPSDLMRPPYGDITHRVRVDVRGLGLVPVLWTIDSRDWTGGSPQQIAARILGALRKHATNIVLQHDGVTNSPNSVSAVPMVVRQARERGFCFTHLGPRGGPAPIVEQPKHTPPPDGPGKARVLPSQFLRPGR